jgi:hypothetical protein
LGRNDVDIYLSAPADWNKTSAPVERPEYQLFALQRQQTQLGQDLLRLRKQPRVEAFVQGGLGRPNPMNFFETDFQPFAMIGLRAAWTPLDWGNTRRDREVYALQSEQIGVQQAAFDRNRAAARLRSDADAAKYDAMLRSDDALIALQEDIIRRADAQVQNGVMTMTDYLAQVDLLTQARLTRETHRIQAWQARERLSQQ